MPYHNATGLATGIQRFLKLELPVRLELYKTFYFQTDLYLYSNTHEKKWYL